MAFFKFRKGADAPAAPPRESIEALRRRARYRLTGAALLVLAGVIGFPLLFDTQPRPIALDIPIDIPDRNKVKPLGPPASAGALQVPVIADPVIAAAPPTSSAGPAARASQAGQPEPGVEGKGEARSSDKVEAGAGDRKAEPRSDAGKADSKADSRESKAEAKPEAKADGKNESKSEAKADVKSARAVSRAEAETLKAKALLEGKPSEAVVAASSAAPPAAAGEGRFVVQVGAFADTAKAQEMRSKVERSGLKTYTHVAETKEGKRTRVRVGPFATRSEADKAAAKIKGLDLPAAVLTL